MTVLATIALAALAAGPAPVDPANINPTRVDPARVVELTLGEGGAGRVAVVFAAPQQHYLAAPRTPARATIFLWSAGRWCAVGAGRYVRGASITDRGGAHRAIRLIDTRERAFELHWRDDRLSLWQRGQQLRVFDAAPGACRS